MWKTIRQKQNSKGAFSSRRSCILPINNKGFSVRIPVKARVLNSDFERQKDGVLD